MEENQEPVVESPVSTATQGIPQDEKNLTVIMEIGVIFLFILSPLIGYLIATEKQTFLKEQSKNALNAMIGYLILLIISTVLSATVILGIIGVPLLIVVGALTLYGGIKGAMESSEGRLFVYPLTMLRVVK